MVNRSGKDDIGGYIELDQYWLPMLHENAIKLNCGRNCLRYLLHAKNIKKIALPYFLCDCVREICEDEQVETRYYNIDENFLPLNFALEEDEWGYIVNYYGQLSQQKIKEYKEKYKKIILDNAHAYFQVPVESVDTIYTCRKFLGVPDGAFLYTNVEIPDELEQDESRKRMEYILGRYERPASESYELYVKNEELFAKEPVKKMSKLTMNFLHGIDYQRVKKKRTQNYSFLYDKLKEINHLELKKIEGAFAYPLLLDNGPEIKRKLIESRIYIPTLWSNVLKDMGMDSREYQYANNILPLPCDQRYGETQMQEMCDFILLCL